MYAPHLRTCVNHCKMYRWVGLLDKTCAYCSLFYKEERDEKVFLQGFNGPAFRLSDGYQGHDLWYSNLF